MFSKENKPIRKEPKYDDTSQSPDSKSCLCFDKPENKEIDILDFMIKNVNVLDFVSQGVNISCPFSNLSKLISRGINLSLPTAGINNVCLIIEENTEENTTIKVKISYSKNPLGKLKTFQMGNSRKLILLACCPGGSGLQKDFYYEYANKKITPEWFELTVMQVKILIGHFASFRLRCESKLNPKNFLLSDEEDDSNTEFNYSEKTLSGIRDKVFEYKAHNKNTVDIIMSVPDWYSIPVIEKIHKVGGKYIEAIQNTILTYYTVTKHKEDFVSFHDFQMLLQSTLKDKLLCINRLPEIIDMVIAKLNKYNAINYTKYKYMIRIIDCGVYDFFNIAFLRLKPEIIRSFKTNINYENAVAAFRDCYGISVSDDGITKDLNKTINLKSVKEVVEHIQSNPIYVRIDMEEFGQYSYGFKHEIERQLTSKYCSNGVTILACFLLGCNLYDIKEDNNTCNIAICTDTVRDRLYRN